MNQRHPQSRHTPHGGSEKTDTEKGTRCARSGGGRFGSVTSEARIHRRSTPTHDTHARRQRRIDHGCNASRRLDNLLALRSCSLRRGHLLLLFLPTLIEHRRTALPACLHRERRRSQVPDGRRTLRQRIRRERQRCRHHALTPKPRGIRACRSCRCQRHRRAQRKFRRLTYPAKPTRRLFAQLLKPSCVLRRRLCSG